MNRLIFSTRVLIVRSFTGILIPINGKIHHSNPKEEIMRTFRWFVFIITAIILIACDFGVTDPKTQPEKENPPPTLSGFSTGLPQWTFSVNDGDGADATCEVENEAAIISVVNGGETHYSICLKTVTPLTFDANSLYEISYTITGTAGKAVNMCIQENGTDADGDTDQYTLAYQQQTLCTGSAQTITRQFGFPTIKSSQKIEFHFGNGNVTRSDNDSASYSISDISLAKIGNIPVNAENELLRNGDFAFGSQNWEQWHEWESGTDANVSYDGNLQITSRNGGSEIWHIKIFSKEKITLSQDEEYTLSFDYSGEPGKQLYVFIEESGFDADADGSNYTSYMSRKLTCDGSPQSFTNTFVPAKSNSHLSITFQAGDSVTSGVNNGTAHFTIDNISLKRTVMPDITVIIPGSARINEKLTAGYWLDGIWNPLTTPVSGYRSQAYRAFLDGDDVYISGYYDADSEGSQRPGYWKNGSWNALSRTSDTASAMTHDVIVNSGDIHAFGTEDTLDGSIPIYWKNNVPSILPYGDYTDAWANQVLVSGTTVHCIGVLTDEAESSRAALWTDGVLSLLPMPVGGVESQSMSSGYVNGHLYIMGFVQDADGVYIGGYWLDGVWTAIPSCLAAFSVIDREGLPHILCATGTSSGTGFNNVAVRNLYDGELSDLPAFADSSYRLKTDWYHLALKGEYTVVTAAYEPIETGPLDIRGYWVNGTWRTCERTAVMGEMHLDGVIAY